MVGLRVVVVAALACVACNAVETVDDEQQALIAPPAIVGGAFTVTANGQAPAIASNGTGFLLVWTDGADIRGTRISAAGAIVDTTPLAIATGSGVQCAPQVASNGTDYYVVWVDQCGTSTAENISGTRVTSAGAVDATPLSIVATTNREDEPRLASNGSDYLVAWRTYNSTSFDVYAALVNHDGTANGGSFPIANAPGYTEEEPAVASIGGNYLVAWSDYRDLAQFDLYGRRVSSAGVVSDPGGALINGSPGDQKIPVLSTNGTSYLAVWTDTRTATDTQRDIYTASIASDTTPSSSVVVVGATNHQEQGALASNGFDYFTAWQDYRAGFADIYGTAIAGTTESASNGFAITNTGSTNEVATALGYSVAAQGYLLAYQVGTGSSSISARLIVQCGDNTIQSGEQCDDGNLVGGDGCSPTCTLEAGFTCTGNPSSCADINECATNNGGCSQVCENTAGSFNCACNPGYGLGADDIACADIDECATNNGGCNQTCTNAAGSYACTCTDGFSLGSDQKTCGDIDECAAANGGCAQVCANTVGAHACACNPGYALDGDGIGCTDVDECATANGGCSEMCSNTVGSFMCACAPTEGLGADGATCMSCPVGSTGDGTTCTSNDHGGGGCSATNANGSWLLALATIALATRSRRCAA